MKFINFIEIKEKAAFLQRIPCLKKLPVDRLTAIASVMRWQTFESGTELLKEGQPVHEFCFIVDGICQAFKRHFNSEKKIFERVFLGEYRRLDCVGEEAVLMERQLAQDQPENGRVKFVVYQLSD